MPSPTLVWSKTGGGGHHRPRCRRNLGEDDPQDDIPVWNLVDLGSDEVEVLPLYWSLRALGKHNASVREAFHSVSLLVWEHQWRPAVTTVPGAKPC
jgi:hypothetical protein